MVGSVPVKPWARSILVPEPSACDLARFAETCAIPCTASLLAEAEAAVAGAEEARLRCLPRRCSFRTSRALLPLFPGSCLSALWSYCLHSGLVCSLPSVPFAFRAPLLPHLPPHSVENFSTLSACPGAAADPVHYLGGPILHGDAVDSLGAALGASGALVCFLSPFHTPPMHQASHSCHYPDLTSQLLVPIPARSFPRSASGAPT